MDQLHFKSAIDIARLIRKREISAAETLEHFLARVVKYNPKLNAIIWLDAEGGRKRAKEADAALARGQVWGPLHGVPMTIKESYNVAGSPTTWGDSKLRNNVTETSALAVERLEKAGVAVQEQITAGNETGMRQHIAAELIWIAGDQGLPQILQRFATRVGIASLR